MKGIATKGAKGRWANRDYGGAFFPQLSFPSRSDGAAKDSGVLALRRPANETQLTAVFRRLIWPLNRLPFELRCMRQHKSPATASLGMG